MQYVSPEIVAKVREIDLFSYLSSCNPGELVRCSANIYCTKTHDSLKISNGKWFWWSRGIGGKSALDYLALVCGMDFLTAVTSLVNKISVIPIKQIADKTFAYDRIRLPQYTFCCHKVRPYLISRGISDAVILEFIKQKKIAESTRNNDALFFGYDEKGEIRQCSARATDGTNRKTDIPGSCRQFSFSAYGGSKNSVRVFESAIDLLSFATLMEAGISDWRKENLLSLSGVFLPPKDMTNARVPLSLQVFLKMHTEIEKIRLHFDRDTAGKLGASGLIEALGKEYDIRYIPPPEGKDFNEYLKKKRNIPIKRRQKHGKRKNAAPLRVYGKNRRDACENKKALQLS